MRERDLQRRARRQRAEQDLGLPTQQPREMAAQGNVHGRQSDLLRLPVIPAEYEIQNPGGSFVFMLDFSQLDGDDGLG
jgi:hypothetical protein